MRSRKGPPRLARERWRGDSWSRREHRAEALGSPEQPGTSPRHEATRSRQEEEASVEAIECLKVFIGKYGVASKAWYTDLTEVVYAYGTYWRRGFARLTGEVSGLCCRLAPRAVAIGRRAMRERGPGWPRNLALAAVYVVASGSYAIHNPLPWATIA